MEFRIEHDSMGEVKVPPIVFGPHRPREAARTLRSVSALRLCLPRSFTPSVS